MKKESVQEYLKRIGRKGGKARAAGHSKRELSKWAKMGGRGHKKQQKRGE